jgi:hypothetical protein
MRRSRALSLFGWFLTVLAVATMTARSYAADRQRSRTAAAGAMSGNQADLQLQLLPAPSADHVAALFGTFVKPGVAPAVVPVDEGPGAAACAPDMVEVDGDYCPYVQQKCLRWLDPATHLQCAEFDKTVASPQCAMKTEHKRFCIDRYEWPNKLGALPRYMANWHEAKASCEAIGKRLCSDTE